MALCRNDGIAPTSEAEISQKMAEQKVNEIARTRHRSACAARPQREV
jgi:hypothetical protein